MQEQTKLQHVPIKLYRSTERVMVATPMPGLQPEDIIVLVNEQGRLVIQGELRGLLKDIKELLIDEWSVGGYYREVELPESVDAQRANVNYGNGVLVVTLPISAQLVPATLTLEKTGTDRGEYAGHSGHVAQNEFPK